MSGRYLRKPTVDELYVYKNGDRGIVEKRVAQPTKLQLERRQV
ncbi:hypothetical protein Xbud_01279 [Xenorhabdus budapestensis]|uniref:Uncharacterized protein n=1 Tax=Xenorhabdus budapestensis TaxID=290110 RepID=A0A2D0J2U9_XENBU|nr:hypothetical protein Xbud_01279 [Xenorhabdus budapestensis]